MLASDDQQHAQTAPPAADRSQLPDASQPQQQHKTDRDTVVNDDTETRDACHPSTQVPECHETAGATDTFRETVSSDAIQSHPSRVINTDVTARLSTNSIEEVGDIATSAMEVDQEDVSFKNSVRDREQPSTAMKHTSDEAAQQLCKLQEELSTSHAKQAELQAQLKECQKLLVQQKHAASTQTCAQSTSETSKHQTTRLDSEEVERIRSRLFKAEKALEAERKMVTILQRQLSSHHVINPQRIVPSGPGSSSSPRPDSNTSSRPAAEGTFEERLKLGGMSMEAALQQHRSDQLALKHVRQENVSLSASLKTATAEVERLQAQVRAADDRARTADGVALDAVKGKSAVAAALDKLVAENDQLTEHTNEQARRLADLQATLEQKEREIINLRKQLKQASYSAAHPAPARLTASHPPSPHTSSPRSPLHLAHPARHTATNTQPTPNTKSPQLAALTSNAHDYLLVLAAEMRRLAEILEDEHGASSALTTTTADNAPMLASKMHTSSSLLAYPATDAGSSPTLSAAVMSVLTPAALEALKLMQSIAAINPNWAMSTAVDFNTDDTLLQLMVLKDEVEELAAQVACLPSNTNTSKTHDTRAAGQDGTAPVHDRGLSMVPASLSAARDDSSTATHSTQSNASNLASSSGTGILNTQLGSSNTTGAEQQATFIMHASQPAESSATSPENTTSSSVSDVAVPARLGGDPIVDRPGTSKPLGALTVPQDVTAASSSRPSPIVPLISPKDKYGIPYAAPVAKEALQALQALSPVGQGSSLDAAIEGEAGYVPIKLATPSIPPGAVSDETKLHTFPQTPSESAMDTLFKQEQAGGAVCGSQAEAAGKLNESYQVGPHRMEVGGVPRGLKPLVIGGLDAELEHDGFVNVSRSTASMMAVPVTETMENRGFDGDIQPLAATGTPRARAGTTPRQRSGGFWGWLVGSAA